MLQAAERCSKTLAVTATSIALGCVPPVALLLAYPHCICTKASKAGNIAQTSKNNCGMWGMGLGGRVRVVAGFRATPTEAHLKPCGTGFGLSQTDAHGVCNAVT